VIFREEADGFALPKISEGHEHVVSRIEPQNFMWLRAVV